MSGYEVLHMDEFIDSLFHDQDVLDIKLPHLPKRWVLEATGDLPLRTF
jgi:hypothetical protein